MKREENNELIKEILEGVKFIAGETYKNFINSFEFSQSSFGKTTFLECLIYSLFTFDLLLHSKKLSPQFRKKYILGILQDFSKNFKNEDDDEDLIHIIDNRFNSYAELPSTKGDNWPQFALQILLSNLKSSKNKTQIQKIYPFEIYGAISDFTGTSVFMKYQPNIFKKASEIVNDIFKEKKEGCYIATMVYKDYNSQEVIKLRKFRDNVLDKKTLGKIFIKIYYFLSPKFVRVFKNNKLINKMCKKLLDKLLVIIK